MSVANSDLIQDRANFKTQALDQYLATPDLQLNRNNAPSLKHFFVKSKSLYFSELSGKIIALDKIDADDLAILNMAVKQGALPSQDTQSFIDRTNKYYIQCNTQITDRGVAEGYWAAKGASVLHHWAHLYESNLQGQVHAQYGYLVSWAAHKVLDWTSSQGPTNFVRMAWFFYAVFGIVYIAIFVHIFREYPVLALAALLIKLFFLSKIGSFMLVLAPGYHWFRELVFIAVPAIVLSGSSHFDAVRWKQNLPMFVTVGVLLTLCYLIDPVFFLISLTCVLLAWLWSYSHFIGDYIKKHRFHFIAILLTFIAAMTAIAVLQTSNLQYVADKLLNISLGPEKYVKRVTLTCFVALAFLLFVQLRRPNFLASYFSFVTLISALYYFITPDSFHFYKFGEYAVPFGVIVIAYISERCSTWFNIHLSSAKIWLNRTLALGMIALALISVVNLMTLTLSWEVRLKDSFGEPYFKSSTYIINNRLIKANMSEKLADHLRSFPASISADFIISPYDKYLTFIYDRSNGFGTPDLIPSLDSSEKKTNALQMIINSKTPVYVLLDDYILHVDTRLGIKKDNSVLGMQHEVSKLNLKARLRAAALADHLLKNCATLNDEYAKGRWMLLQCSIAQ